MSNEQPPIGSITWFDLTVENADEVRAFYQRVVGWNSTPQSMGDHDDFNMQLPENDETVAGICHSRGVNAEIPPQWMIYITVADVDASAQACETMGGSVLLQPRACGNKKMCIIRDPAGAVCALYGS